MIYNLERPRNFDQVVGQKMVVENIRNQSIRNQFFPVFILCGQYGSGKTTMARLIAMAANCEHKDEKGNPCGECESCQAVMEHSSDGVIEIDGASNNGVDSIRKLLSQSVTMGLFKKKVIVIDEAHKLSNSAFNALLIPLENPPEHCIFILCTTEKDMLPETIVSRAPVYVFGKIEDVLIKEHILYVAEKNNIGITFDAAGLLARYANGAMRNALQLLEHLSLQKLDGEDITGEDVVKILGLSSMEERGAFLDACLHSDVKEIISLLRACERKGYSLRTFIQDVLQMNTDMLFYKAGAEVVGTQFYLEQIKQLSSVSDVQITKLNKMLSSIASTPAYQLSVDRIVADIISVVYAPAPVVQTIPVVQPAPVAKIEHVEAMPVTEQPVKEVVKEEKQEKVQPQVKPEVTEEKKAEVKEESKDLDGFQNVADGEDIPFETEEPVKEEPVKEKQTEPVGTMGTFGFAGGFGFMNNSFFGNSFASSSSSKKSAAKDASRAQEAVAGAVKEVPKSVEPEEVEHDFSDIAVQGIGTGEVVIEEDEREKEFPAEEEDIVIENPDKAELTESEHKEQDADSTMKDSIPENQEGRISWDEAAKLGIVPDRAKISLPKPETTEELNEQYKSTEVKEEDKDEEEEYSTRDDLKQAKEDLGKLLKNPGFKILYSKCRMEIKDNRIYLYFDGKGKTSLAKTYLTKTKGIYALCEKD